MKIIIPVKSNSLRVPNKNFRNFCYNKSLTDILIEKLLFKDPSNIYLSSDDLSKSKLAENYKCNFLLRDKKLCDNDVSIPELIQGITKQIPNEDEIAWCQVIDPLFNDYENVFNIWEKEKVNYDSLCVVYPVKKYLLNHKHMPVNFGFGPWHIKSQNLETYYDMTFTFSILKKECIEKCGYHIGSNVLWYHAKNIHVDIDTIEDFELASYIYEKQMNQKC